MHFITESILIGNMQDAQNIPANISAFLWAAGDLRITPPAGLPYAIIPLTEYAEPDPIDIEAGVDWLARRPPSERVLVCCRAGMGRSVSIVIAFLCCVKGMTYEEAYKLVKGRRAEATPLPNLQQVIEEVKKIRSSPEIESTDKG